MFATKAKGWFVGLTILYSDLVSALFRSLTLLLGGIDLTQTISRGSEVSVWKKVELFLTRTGHMRFSELVLV